MRWFTKTGILFSILISTQCFGTELERILGLSTLQVRVDQLTVYLSIYDPKLKEPESQAAFETVDAQIETQIRKHLKTESFPIVFQEEDESLEESIERSGMPSTFTLKEAYLLKQQLAEFRAYPLDQRMRYDFLDASTEVMLKEWISFAEMFQSNSTPLTDEMWRKLAVYAGHEPDERLRNEFFALVFKQRKKISDQTLNVLSHRFPILNFKKLSLTQKHILAVWIADANPDQKPDIIKFFKIDEGNLHSVTSLLNLKDIISPRKAQLAFLKLSPFDLIRSQTGVQKQFLLYEFLFQKFHETFGQKEMHWEKIKAELSQGLSEEISAAVLNKQTQVAIRLLMLKNKLNREDDPEVRKNYLELLQDSNSFSQVISHSPTVTSLYPEYYSDILSESQFHRDSAVSILSFFLIAPETASLQAHSKLDFQFVVDELISRIADANYSMNYVPALRLIRNLSHKKNLRKNTFYFFKALFQKEGAYLSQCKNEAKALEKPERISSLFLTRDSKLKDFIQGEDLVTFFEDPELKAFAAQSILEAYITFPTDLVPESALNAILKDPDLKIRNQSLIEQVMVSIILHHQYSDDSLGVIKKGDDAVPLKFLSYLTQESSADTLLSHLIQLRRAIKEQELSEKSPVRENIISEIARKIHLILEVPSLPTCATLLSTFSTN